QEKKFRQDLFFRLNVLPIHIPPLRERKEDVPAISQYLLTCISRRRGGRPLVLTEEAERALVAYSWPGNVRELDNVLQRTSAFCAGPRITRDDLPSEIYNEPTTEETAPSTQSLADLRLRDIEKMAILQTLKSCNGNRAEAARRLGISKKGIYIKMKRL